MLTSKTANPLDLIPTTTRKGLLDDIAPSMNPARAIKPPNDAPFELSQAHKLAVRTQADKGTPHIQIAHLICAAHPERAKAAREAITAFLAAPEPEISDWCPWCKLVPGRKAGTVELEVDKYLFQQYITEQGGFYMLPVEGEKPLIVRVKDNVVEEASRRDVKLFIQQQVQALPGRSSYPDKLDLLNLILDKNRGLFDAEVLDFIADLNANFVRDTKHTAFFFFQNGWVEVTATTCERYPYKALPGHIWKSQIRPHDFVPLSAESYQQSDFHQFMCNAFGHDPQRIRAAELAQGYMLHNFKEDTNTKCIIFEDKEAEPGSSDGRTGKSLHAVALGHLRNTVTQDGRLFSFEDNFRWQKVQRDTEVFVFDEWKARQPFEQLFATISGAWSVNKKNQPEFTIPFKRSPKIVISTNDVITGRGDSFNGRVVKIAVDRFYSKSYTPEMVHGRAFFGSAWDEDGGEWNRFLNLAVGWVQLFLANDRKLESVELAETKAREFMAQTEEGFPEFLEYLKQAARDGDRKELVDSVNGTLCIWLDDAHSAWQRENATSPAAKDKRKFSNYLRLAGCAKDRYTKRNSTRQGQYFYTWGEAA